MLSRAADLKREAHAVYLACRDPRVPWLPKAIAALVAVYALSPIDLIPDFIPVIGYLDDLVLVPLGLALAVRLIPHEILEEHRARVRQEPAEEPPTSGTAGPVASRRPSHTGPGGSPVAAARTPKTP